MNTDTRDAAALLGIGLLIALAAGCADSPTAPTAASYTPSALGADGSARVGLLNDDHREPFANTNCGDRPIIQRPNPNSDGDRVNLVGRFPAGTTRVDWVFRRRANVAGQEDRQPYPLYRTYRGTGNDAVPSSFFVSGYYSVQAFAFCGNFPSTGGGSNVEEFGWMVEALGSSVEEPAECVYVNQFSCRED